MNKFIQILFLALIAFSLQAGETGVAELKALKSIKKIEKSKTKEVFKTFIKVNHSLNDSLDDDLVKELARVYTLLHKVDDNYYTLEPFSNLLKKKNSPFKAKMKKFLPKKDYKIFNENAESLLNEIENGNG